MSQDHLWGACGCSACADSGASALPRRRFLALGAAAGVAVATLGAGARALAQTTMTPDQALEALMAGNRRYVNGGMTSFDEKGLAALRAATVAKQEPFAAVLACADSRVPVEIVFDESIGRLFVARVAGNVATTEVIASLEYGVAVLGTKAIMVLAHQSCGAVHAAVIGEAVPGQISALYAPLQQAVADGHHDYEATAKLNAQYQARLLTTASPVLAEKIAKGELKIVAGYYALGSGQVSLL